VQPWDGRRIDILATIPGNCVQGIDFASGKKCAGYAGGEVLPCGRLGFRDLSRSQELILLWARLSASRFGVANEL
jgi:hypothetical protein